MVDVTDHALLRYIERGHGCDVEAMRRDLAQRLQRAAAAAEKIGPSQYHVALDGLHFVVRDGKVTTILLNEDPTGHRRQGIARA